MSKLVLDDVLEYIAEKTEDEQAAQALLLNLNQDELEYLFDMAERHYRKPVGVESCVNNEMIDRIFKNNHEHGTWGGFPLT